MSEGNFETKTVVLKNRTGMTIELLNLGATWTSCKIPHGDALREVLLSPGSIENIQKHTAYMGTSVGRYANRIKGGQYQFKGESVQLKTNQAGNTLHGGPLGFDRRIWDVKEQSANRVVFELISEDGDQGFPGRVIARTVYALGEDNSVNIEYRATTDKPTAIGLTNHAYFNLDGEGSILEHQLTVDARQYLPTNEVGIPLGELEAVSGTGFDFRQAKALGRDLLCDDQQRSAKGYDHAFFFALERDVREPVATLASSDGRVTMDVLTNQPAMQVYTGNWLAGNPKREGGEYQDYAGVALETQLLPDSPNHPHWPQPSAMLLPNEEYLHKTSYLFRSDD
ncbi:galactose-1-epimerase [Vibrio sp. SCSIO 43136]|uniref:galactose-1-epimerase n=1 Tax=Vibrio sp. SCSIO 43136 TaxID=2819101 RepID=UPI002074B2A7|nr:galactose-1-epimerase [Vibrio sp. SCSIO 43136]USD66999.1 galactose-1-epimerase [Vibrio sp. SCSIO 43136]